jgi:hypothetical protein
VVAGSRQRRAVHTERRDLRQLTEHFFDEVQMTFDLADVLNTVFATPVTTPQAQLVRNAVLEASRFTFGS